MIEIKALDEAQFLRLAETLTRMGMVKRRKDHKPKLYQTAHVYHSKGKYYIAHFKTLYELEGAPDNELTREDTQRLNNIVHLLYQWGLVEPVDPLMEFDPDVRLMVVKYANKDEYELVQPYKIGKR